MEHVATQEGAHQHTPHWSPLPVISEMTNLSSVAVVLSLNFLK